MLFAFAVLGFAAVFFDLGELKSSWSDYFHTFYRVCLAVFVVLFGIRAYLQRFVFRKRRERWMVAMELIFLLVLILSQFHVGFLENYSSRGYLQFAISVIFLVEISRRSLALERLKVDPPLLFIFSFLLIILVGAFALTLPVASVKGVGFIDALFTSTSAVCVTGLTVMDTGTEFTRFGQNIILTLISLGGLGVMTFTSFFGFFFKGEASFRNQMIYRDFTGESHITNVFGAIIKIVAFTLSVEAAGAIFLFLSLKPEDYPDVSERIYFSVFHAISAFNNAGFQLKMAGLYDETLRWNYPFQMGIATLIIFGGLGFFISFNVTKYFRQRIVARLRSLILGDPLTHVPWIISFNTRIVIITTFLLLVVGTGIFYATEYNASLKEHEGIGKLVVAFFLSVTPRTAGFNDIDMAVLTREGIMITLLLMWIGASPNSTGGGIKTTTFAVATLGIFNLARGRERIEFGRREVAQESLMRSFIIICLSLIALGFSIFAVVWSNPQLDMVKIAFECFSAFGTVGLSLGITSDLSDMGKLVISLTMFVGRVGTYTILLAILKKAADPKFYRYPVENVIIT